MQGNQLLLFDISGLSLSFALFKYLGVDLFYVDLIRPTKIFEGEIVIFLEWSFKHKIETGFHFWNLVIKDGLLFWAT